MFEVEKVVEDHYSQAYQDRFENIDEDEKDYVDECDCGRKKDKTDKFCEVCKNTIIEQFKKLIHEK